MLSPLFDMIKNGGLKNITLQLSFTNGNPCVIIQGVSDYNDVQLLNPMKSDEKTKQACEIRAAIAAPIVIKSNDIEQIDTELAITISEFCSGYKEQVQDNNLIAVLDDLKSVNTKVKKTTPKTSTTKPSTKPATTRKKKLPEPQQPLHDAATDDQTNESASQAKPAAKKTEKPSVATSNTSTPKSSTEKTVTSDTTKPDESPIEATSTPSKVSEEAESTSSVSTTNFDEDFEDLDDDLRHFCIS